MSAAALALTVPAGAQAAKPSRGSWWNGSARNGAAFDTRGLSVQNVSFFCNRWSYDLKENVPVHRDGTFRYSGPANLWGHEHQWRGNFHVTLSGRFVSPHRVTIRRTLQGCGTATVIVGR